jgi:YVTN family beta-propeller protein
VRSTTFALVLSLSSAVVLANASACSERYPLEAPPADGGAPVADASEPPLEKTPPAVVPEDKRVDVSSSPVVFDPLRGGVWTANGDAGSVSYVDVDARAIVQEIPVGKEITSVALSPDARWIAAVDRASGTVAFIDAEARVARRTIAVGSHPRAAAWDAADPRWLYVAEEDDGAVAVIDRMAPAVVRHVPVGRIPSGVAVSRLRRELYVTHRIDGRVSIVPLDGPSDVTPALVEVTLANEPQTGDPKVPNGRPFAFESLAWAPDGKRAWLPHQLFAPAHPFQFQSVIFPAVSVVDLAARAEVVTDPAAGTTAGRKNLFAAINVLDTTGNASVMAQPCAAAIHPKGYAAYALACGSEDLLVFDMLTGKAIDLVRGIPGDHPIGLTLDDTGQRAFILADQSKELTVIDTADGSLIKRVTFLGEKPIKVVSKDPIDPEMREGLKLFYNANSSKGPLAATGNNWMACGSCHLDGFVSTNMALFEGAHVADAKVDARIGHVGLKDLFATAPRPSDPAFDPHDVLVAFADQGGLAPDRSGKQREGAIDPAAPTPDARTMAARVARVIARDLPLGPSWLLGGDTKPDPKYDGEWCGSCHQPEYEAWRKSVHAKSAEDPMVVFGLGVEIKARGPQYAGLCAGCHDPVSARLGETSLASKRGITCIGCHDTERLIHAGGNADLEARAHDWQADHRDRAKKGLETLRDPRFCGGCHQQFVPATGIEAISTLHEWQRSPYAGGDGTGSDGSGEVTLCVDCHAQKDDRGIADHAMIGGNVYMAGTDADMIQKETANLKRAISLRAARVSDTILVTVKNRAAGHAFPTGVTDVREPWVELQAVDPSHKVLARYGGPGADGLVPAGAARLGLDIAKEDGTLLFLHELSETTRLPFERRVPAFGETDLVVTPPKALPPGAVGLDAVLLYRNVRTPYFRAATGDPKAIAPEVEVARVAVPVP